MDTVSLYLGLSADKIEDVVKPELKSEHEKDKNNWLVWDKQQQNSWIIKTSYLKVKEQLPNVRSATMLTREWIVKQIIVVKVCLKYIMI